MRVGFDGSRAFQEFKTGTENYSYQLLKFLSHKDSQNDYIVYLSPHANPGKDWPDNFRFKTISLPRFWTQAGLAAQTFKDPLDVLFIPAHTSPLIHKPNLKTVVTVHDLGAEYLSRLHQLKQRLYLKWITHYQLKTATKLIAVSKATKDDLVKKVGINPKKIEVVYEGYNQSLYRPVKGDILINSLKQYSISPGQYFLFVGTIQPRKNLERLIRAFAQMVARHGTKNRSTNRSQSSAESLVSLEARPPIIDYTVDSPHFLATRGFATPKLVLVGSKGWLSDEIYKLPKKLGIEDRVKFLGYVPDRDMPALYSGAAALVFPSLFEGFGLPILEAQACGCLVVTSEISSMPEVAGKGAILVDPLNIDKIADNLLKVLDQKVRERLTDQGFSNIKRFSWEKCARQTLEVLEKAAKQK